MTKSLSVFAACILLAAAHAVADVPQRITSDTLPTTQQLQEMVDAGKYKEALRAIFRVLELKGDAAAPYDRTEILLLRAECQLQNKDRSGALDSLALVRKETQEADKHPLFAKAVALETLISHAPAFTYTPKTGESREPISILDRIKRPRAMLTLYNDEMVIMQPKFKAAKAAKSLPPIVEFAKTVAGIRALEFAVNGNNDDTKEMFGELATHAADLMSAEADNMTSQVGAIESHAKQLVNEDYTVMDPVTKRPVTQHRLRQRGLINDDASVLKSIINTCDKYAQAAKELGVALGAEPKLFQPGVKKADDTSTKATIVLNTDYTIPVK